MCVAGGQSNEAVHTPCVRRVALERAPRPVFVDDDDGALPLWFVKVTIGGDRLAESRVQRAIERLSTDRAFVVSVRYDGDRAEIRYWDECGDADEAIRQALGLWGDEEVASRLPGWRVIGLEVMDRRTARRQWDRGDHPRVFALGEILPFDR
jgi:hypothetical protein